VEGDYTRAGTSTDPTITADDEFTGGMEAKLRSAISASTEFVFYLPDEILVPLCCISG